MFELPMTAFCPRKIPTVLLQSFNNVTHLHGHSLHFAQRDHGLVQHRDLGGAAHVAAGHGDGFGQVVGALPTQTFGHVRVICAGGDDAPDVLAAVLAPVPHEERMRAVIGVAAPVHLDV